MLIYLKNLFAKKQKFSDIQLAHSEEIQTLCENLSFGAAESYKMLRANLSFVLPSKKGCNIIGVTSSIRSEGKSTTSINTAYTLSQTGEEVLLIDADMRLPSVSKKLKIPGTPGLSDVLAENCTAEATMLRHNTYPGWKIMPAGTIPPNPSELLGSERMGKLLEELAGRFNYIVIDLPPVNIVSDAITVSKWLDGLLVAARCDYTNKQTLDTCMAQLYVIREKILGFVMTDVPADDKYFSEKYYGAIKK